MEKKSLHEELMLAVDIYIKESEKFESGVKASAVRARQALFEMKDLLVLRRKEIQEKKREM